MIKWGDWIAIYAAVLSTIVAIIEIIKYRRDTSSSLMIELNSGIRHDPLITLRVVNTSTSHVYVKSPFYYLRFKSTTDFWCIPIDKTNLEFPYRLEPNEPLELSLSRQHLTQNIESYAKKKLRELELKDVRACINDSKGKTYFSKALRDFDQPNSWKGPI